MKVVIAEKPSMGRDIARVLGATKACDGYMEGSLIPAGKIANLRQGTFVGTVAEDFAEETHMVQNIFHAENDPNKIHLSADDLTPDGLARAINNNHAIKTIAIVYKQPQVVQASHVQQITARMQDASLKTSAALAKVVQDAYEKKLAPPTKISNITLSAEQRNTLQEGKAIFVQGLTDKTGKVDRYITWNKESGRIKSSATDPTLQREQAAKVKVTEKPKQEPAKKKKGMKM